MPITLHKKCKQGFLQTIPWINSRDSSLELGRKICTTKITKVNKTYPMHKWWGKKAIRKTTTTYKTLFRIYCNLSSKVMHLLHRLNGYVARLMQIQLPWKNYCCNERQKKAIKKRKYTFITCPIVNPIIIRLIYHA